MRQITLFITAAERSPVEAAAENHLQNHAIPVIANARQFPARAEVEVPSDPTSVKQTG